MSLAIIGAIETLNSPVVEKAVGDIGDVIKSRQQHQQYIEKESQNHVHQNEKENQNHYHHIEKESQNHVHQTEREEKNHRYDIEKEQQSHNSEVIKSTFYVNSEIIKKSFEDLIKREDEDRKEKNKYMSSRIQELEKRNYDNMRFMGQIYSQREDCFNKVIDIAEQIRYEIQSSSKDAECQFYEHVNLEPKKEKIRNHCMMLKKLFSEARDEIIKINHDISNIESSLIKSDGQYEQILNYNPKTKNGYPDENFFKYAEFVLKKHLIKNRKEIELLERTEDKDRIEKDLKSSEDILNELENHDRNGLFKLISNITSTRKLSGIMHVGNKITQKNEADGVIDAVVVSPPLELTN